MNKLRIKIFRVSIGLLAGLCLILTLYFLVAYRIYYGAEGAELPCRGCTGEARVVRINGFDLFYREVGTNSEQPPVVIVHGGPGMSSQYFKKSFDFLSSTRRVIYYDQRGSGNSQIKPDPANYSIEQLINELEILRREVIGTDRIILVGHSAGGALVQRYALAFPENVDKMILVCSILPNYGVQHSSLWLDAVNSGFSVIAGIPGKSPEETDRRVQVTNHKFFVERLYNPNRKELLQDIGYVSFVTGREVTRSIQGGDFEAGLRRLLVETLLIYGAADISRTGEPTADYLAKILPHAQIVRFDKSGHWPFLEEPEKFQQVLSDFIE